LIKDTGSIASPLVPPVSKKNPYSIDLNLLGRSIEAGPLEDPFEMPSEEVFGITSSIADQTQSYLNYRRSVKHESC
jgi:argininosuccinate synthase